MPQALRELLARARADLKTKQAAKVTLTMTEVRAIYALSTQLHAAREARDTHKRAVQKVRKELVEAQKAARDQDLLNNRAVVALLIEVQRVLNGEETSDAAVVAIGERLGRYIKRARDASRKSAARRQQRPTIDEEEA